jgi:hypothetical protein
VAAGFGAACGVRSMSPPDTTIDLNALAAAVAERLAPLVSERLRADGEALLKEHQLAERLQLSDRGVRGLVARGELPPGFLVGGVRRWDWAEVVKHLHARGGRRPRRGRGRYTRALKPRDKQDKPDKDEG